jgi:hypothetical protein
MMMTMTSETYEERRIAAVALWERWQADYDRKLQRVPITESDIRSKIEHRNEVRTRAQLPLLDVEKEYTKARSLAQEAVWNAFCATRRDDLRRLENEVLAEYQPRGWIAQWGASHEAHKRFVALIMPDWRRSQVNYSKITQQIAAEGDCPPR